MEKHYIHWQTQMGMRIISCCQWVTGTRTWQQGAEESAVNVGQKGQEIGEGFSLACWAMGMVTE